MGPVSETGTGDGDASMGHLLVLPVQWQVVEEFIHEQACEQADIGDAAIDHLVGHDGGLEGVRPFFLEDGQVISQYHVACRAFGQFVTGLGVDDFVLIGVGAVECIRNDMDVLDRHVDTETQTAIGDTRFVAAFLGLAALVAVDGLFFTRFRRCLSGRSQQTLLIGVFNQTLFGFMPEDLFFKPGDAVL